MRFSVLLCFLVCYCQSNHAQVFDWANSVGGGGFDRWWSIDLDRDLNVYAIGSYEDTIDVDPGPDSLFFYNQTNYGDMMVSKFDEKGRLIWARNFHGESSEVGYMKVSDSNFVYVVGHFEDSVDFDPGPGAYFLDSKGSYDVFILKLDSSGNFVWARSIGGSGWDFSSDLKVLPDGGIVFTGAIRGTADMDPGPAVQNFISNGEEDIFVEKLNSNGNLEWAISLGGPRDDVGRSLELDSKGNVYLTGDFSNSVDFDPGPNISSLSSKGGQDPFILKLGPGGGFRWARSFGGTGADLVHSIALDESLNIHLCGAFEEQIDFDPGSGINSGTADNYDGYILKLDSSGNFIWANQLGGKRIQSVESISVDRFGGVYATGVFEDVVDFRPGVKDYILKSKNLFDAFVWRLNKFGNFSSAYSFGGKGRDYGIDIVQHSSGQVVICGSFFGRVDFDPGPGTHYLYSTDTIFADIIGGQDAYLLKLSTQVNSMGEDFSESVGDFSILPNPTNGKIFIRSEINEKVKITVFDPYGNTIFQNIELLQGVGEFEISGPPGLYLVRIDFNGGYETYKVLKK